MILVHLEVKDVCSRDVRVIIVANKFSVAMTGCNDQVSECSIVCPVEQAGEIVRAVYEYVCVIERREVFRFEVQSLLIAEADGSAKVTLPNHLMEI
jgi:hypothetical protein